MPHYSLKLGRFTKKEERQEKDYTRIWLVLTNDVPPTDSQDDKILPEHSKFNPKEKFMK